MTPYWALKIQAHRKATTVLGNSHGSSEVRIDGGWHSVATVADNRVRRRLHDVDLDGVTDLRIRVLSTNGSAYAAVVEVRAYAERGS